MNVSPKINCQKGDAIQKRLRTTDLTIRQVGLFAKLGYLTKMHSTKKGLGKKTCDEKDIRQKQIRRLVLFRQKFCLDHNRRVVIVPFYKLKLQI